MINYDPLLKSIQKIENCRVLSTKEIKELDYKFFYEGTVWEIDTEITYKNAYKSIILYINFPETFPFSLPKVYIDKYIYDELKYIPHINHDFSICIFDEELIHPNFDESSHKFIEYLIYQAKNIIRLSESAEYNKIEFQREFKAYWEIEYNKNDKILNIGLHLIKSFKKGLIKGIKLKNAINNYEYVLYTEDDSWGIFKKFLDFKNLKYDEVNVLEIENSFIKPPFSMTFKQSLEILKSNFTYTDFKKSIRRTDFDKTLIIFRNFTNDNTEIFGWTYKEFNMSLYKLKRHNNRLKNIEILEHPLISSNYVFRITFDDLTSERLQLRTSGIVEENKSVAISGLGSVGSNLIHFLKNLPINSFNLIDEDFLKLENINRHFLGFNYVNRNKVDVLKSQLLNSNPLLKIEVIKKSILTVINEFPNIVNDCDFHIVAIGRTLIENFILNSILEKKTNKPVILFWVEPYLASGQMLFVNPNDAEKAIKLINNFHYHVLSEDNIKSTYIKEGSCQSGYFPYSSTYLTQFISAIFPYLKEHIALGNIVSTAYSWIGDKELINSKGLKMTTFACTKKSYDLLINLL